MKMLFRGFFMGFLGYVVLALVQINYQEVDPFTGCVFFLAGWISSVVLNRLFDWLDEKDGK